MGLFVKLILGAVVASVMVGSLVGGLQSWVNRPRSSQKDTAPDPEPVRLTEEQRAEAWAELRPTVKPALTRRERQAAEKARRRALVEQRLLADDMAALERIERAATDGVAMLWTLTLLACDQDEVDAEWAALSSGELPVLATVG